MDVKQGETIHTDAGQGIGSMDIAPSVECITANSLVQDVVNRYPQAVIILARRGLQCAGCYIAPFHTITDCAREYSVDIESLLGDLNRSITEVRS